MGVLFECCATTILSSRGRKVKLVDKPLVVCFRRKACNRLDRAGACPPPRLKSLDQWRPRMPASLRRARRHDWPMEPWVGGKAGLPNEAKLPAEGVEGSGLKAARPVESAICALLGWQFKLK